MPAHSSRFPNLIRPGKPGLILLLFAWTVLSTVQCGTQIYLVSSLGPPRAIVVDGDNADWTGALSYAEKEHLFVGFVNDRDDLYICLTTEGRESGGPVPHSTWTVWFDPAGATNKALGLRLTRPERKPEAEPSGEIAPRGDDESLEILGPQGDVIKKMSLKEAADQGLEIREGVSGEAFVLEAKIPLVTSKGHTVAVGAGPSGVVGIGFMSSRPARKDWREGPPGGGVGAGGGRPGDIGMPGGGGRRGGMGGPGGGMRGGSRPNMNPDIPKDIKVWTRVKLLATSQPGPSKVLSLATE